MILRFLSGRSRIPQGLRSSLCADVARSPRNARSTSLPPLQRFSLSLCMDLCLTSRAFISVSIHPFSAQNPGRVVTLVHQEDWAVFSSAVRFFFPFFHSTLPLYPQPSAHYDNTVYLLSPSSFPSISLHMRRGTGPS